MTKTAMRKAARALRDANLIAEERKKQTEKDMTKWGSIVCSGSAGMSASQGGSWFEAVVYRKEQYAPNFQCQCARCRHDSPDRLNPRSARESLISTDCQGEALEPDVDAIMPWIKDQLKKKISPDEVYAKIISIFPNLEVQFLLASMNPQAERLGGSAFKPRHYGTSLSKSRK